MDSLLDAVGYLLVMSLFFLTPVLLVVYGLYVAARVDFKIRSTGDSEVTEEHEGSRKKAA